MKGIILEYNIATAQGLISAQDGNRYDFEGIEYKGAVENIRSGSEVDFQLAENGAAIGVYLIGKQVSTTERSKVVAGLLALNLSVVLMVVAFFLPWVTAYSNSLSGYGLASSGNYWLGTSLFLIPILSIVLLANDIKGFLDDNKKKYLTYATAVIPLIYIAERISTFGVGRYFEYVTIGIYLTLVASVTMLLGGIGIVKK